MTVMGRVQFLSSTPGVANDDEADHAAHLPSHASVWTRDSGDAHQNKPSLILVASSFSHSPHHLFIHRLRALAASRVDCLTKLCLRDNRPAHGALWPTPPTRNSRDALLHHQDARVYTAILPGLLPVD